MSQFVEKTQAFLKQIERLNPSLNVFISVQAQSALEQARRVDDADRAGVSLGALHGMVISVKDNIDTAGVAATAGAEFLREHVPAQDAPVVQRLRDAGAIVIGKVNLAELAFGSRSYSAVGGQCRNPWNPSHIPGGSSGGSGASVAADMCEGSLGTDTGGSVRLPACFNGVSGLRPTHGRIPIRGVQPVSEHNDTVGPLARSVQDVARLYAVIAGYDALDATAADRPVEDVLPKMKDPISGLRIGIPRHHYFEALEAGVGEAVMAAARLLQQHGAVLVEVDVPLARDAHFHTSRAVYADVCHVYHDRLLNAPETITASVVERMREGFKTTGVQYAEAMAFRDQLRLGFREIFGQVDVMLSPTAPVGAPVIEDNASLLEATKAATRNTYAGAFASLPGLSIPCGFTERELPIGLQLEASWWNEATLLQLGAAYQGLTQYHEARAPMVSGAPAA
ncbi:MAG: amidase [Ottowia sp.]|uniref:amidase n=1 Tax=Ottowia sp. TaxID=1898956 RepID=UPI003C75092D